MPSGFRWCSVIVVRQPPLVRRCATTSIDYHNSFALGTVQVQESEASSVQNNTDAPNTSQGKKRQNRSTRYFIAMLNARL